MAKPEAKTKRTHSRVFLAQKYTNIQKPNTGTAASGAEGDYKNQMKFIDFSLQVPAKKKNGRVGKVKEMPNKK